MSSDKVVEDGIEIDVKKARNILTSILVAEKKNISTKEKAQQFIGLDMADKEAKKKEFLNNIVPEWLKDAKAKERI